jgi:hypothetical protein
MKAGLVDKAICSLVMTRLSWATDIEARPVPDRRFPGIHGQHAVISTDGCPGR